MATATVNTPAAINTQPEYTTKRKEMAFGLTINEKGEQVPVVLDLDDAQKLEAEEKFQGSVVTVVYDLPTNWAAVRAFESGIYLDDEGKPRDINEVLKDLTTLFRVGMTTKIVNRTTTRLLERDKDGNFTFSDKELTDGVFNVTSYVTSPSQRKFKSEEEKVWDSLGALPKDTRDNMWKVYLTANGKDFYIPAE